MIRNLASKFIVRVPPVFTINTVATTTALTSRINTLTSVLNKDSMPILNNTLIGTFNPCTVNDHRPFWPKDHVFNTAEDVSTIVDGVEVERMELKKRLYKSYKSRKLSNPSTKSRRRHMQSNR